MIFIDLAVGLGALFLVGVAAVKIADKLKIVETVKKWGKKED